MSPYQERDRILRGLGFPSYAAYLASPLWRSIRERVFAAIGRRCSVCGTRKRIQIHHRAYTVANLSGTSFAGLMPVCDLHHARAEVKDGKKASLAVANARLRKRSRWPTPRPR